MTRWDSFGDPCKGVVTAVVVSHNKMQARIGQQTKICSAIDPLFSWILVILPVKRDRTGSTLVPYAGAVPDHRPNGAKLP